MPRQNNFDFLRLLFSSLVILSHSFPLTHKPEILGVINPEFTFGEISVQAFFIMSGYLIFISMKNSKSVISYFWKRIIRLFPGLFIMLFLTVLFLPLINTDILNQSDYYSYLPNCLSLFLVQYHVSGIFTENPYPLAINGSLWSLSYEFLMYVFIGFLFIFKKFKYLNLIIITTFIVFYFLNIFNPEFLKYYMIRIRIDSLQFYRLATFFMAGAILSFVKSPLFNNKFFQFSLLITLVLSIKYSFYNESAPIILSLLIIPFANSYNKNIQIPKSFGDISYGVYVYGFIVQQSIMYFFNLTTLPLFILSIIITYTFAYFSWHYIEKEALKWRSI